MDRIDKICSYIDPCESFADVGCDHGYCTLYALKRGLCKSAIISDVSAKSLQKAEKLLAAYIKGGGCRSVCCDGLEDIPRDIGQVLIAGMGGIEIVKILENAFIPEKFIFQPMKNAPYLREYLIARGCKITDDDIFRDGKFYFIIKGQSSGGTPKYSKEELFFGRNSMRNPLIREYAAEELAKLENYLVACPKNSDTQKIKEQISLLKDITSL